MADGARHIDRLQDLSIDRADRERASCIGRRNLLQTVNMRMLTVAGVVGLRCGIAWRCFYIKRIVMMVVVVMIAVAMLATWLLEISVPVRHNDFPNAMPGPARMGMRRRRRQNAKLRQGDREQTGQELAKDGHQISVSASLLPLIEEPPANMGWSAPAQAISRSRDDQLTQYRPPASPLERQSQGAADRDSPAMSPRRVRGDPRGPHPLAVTTQSTIPATNC